MLAVGSSLATSLALLQAFDAGPVQPTVVAVPQQVQPALTGASKVGLSASAADAVLTISARPAATVADPAEARATYARSIGIPAQRVAWLESFGADAWAVREPLAMDDADFETRVLQSMETSGSAKLHGFADARANGTLRISRASEVPELGYKTFQVTLYKDGEAIGGAGFGTADADLWAALQASGIAAANGSVDGNDYVVTWPMSPASRSDAVAR